MESYSTFELYQSIYKGELDEDDYIRFAIKAKLEIDRITANKAGNNGGIMQERLALCECEIIDAMHYFNDIPAGIVSENTDGYSVTYDTARSNSSSVEMDSERKEYRKICERYLRYPTNLLSRW